MTKANNASEQKVKELTQIEKQLEEIIHSLEEDRAKENATKVQIETELLGQIDELKDSLQKMNQANDASVEENERLIRNE